MEDPSSSTDIIREIARMEALLLQVRESFGLATSHSGLLTSYCDLESTAPHHLTDMLVVSRRDRSAETCCF